MDLIHQSNESTKKQLPIKKLEFNDQFDKIECQKEIQFSKECKIVGQKIAQIQDKLYKKQSDQKVIDLIYEQLQRWNYAMLMILHHRKRLQEILQQPYFKPKIQNILQNYQQFFKLFPAYKCQFKQDKKEPGKEPTTIFQQIILICKPYYQGQKNTFRQLIRILKSLNEIQINQKDYAWRIAINQIMVAIASQACVSSVFAKHMCCKFSYEINDKFNFREKNNAQYKNYRWPLEGAPKLLLQLQKVITGFLNREGGIIYIGIWEEKKCPQVKAIILTYTEKKQFIKLMKQKVCEGIYPKIVDQQIQQLSPNQYILSNQIAIDFLPVITKSKVPFYSQEGVPGYIARIIIKFGNPYRTYCLFNDNLPVYYKRNDEITKQYKIEEYIQEVHNRLKQQAEGLIISKKNFHDDCLFEFLQKNNNWFYRNDRINQFD